MHSYDNSIIAAMVASEREVMRVGGNAIGTEHVLLGLLATGGSVAAQVQQAEPRLTVASVRAALEQSIDDLPHLQRLGIDPQRVLASAGASYPGPLLAARGSHTAEFQGALQSASVKMSRLEKLKALSDKQKASSSVLWLAVLEPDTRGHRLLAAMALDSDVLRGVVLAALTDPEAPTPVWPEQARPGLFTRFILWLSTRLHVAR